MLQMADPVTIKLLIRNDSSDQFANRSNIGDSFRKFLASSWRTRRNIFDPSMTKQCNPISVKGIFLDLQKLFHIELAQSTPSLQRGKITPNECPGYNPKQSDGEAPVILELWRMLSSPSLQSLPGPLWLGEVAPDRVLSMG